MPNQKDYAVLLHGLWRTTRTMRRLEKALAKEGYTAINVPYPSYRAPVEELAEKYLSTSLLKNCPDATKKINFVTYSLGGIIVRYFLTHHPLKNVGRVVMIATPNHGSKYADILSKFKIAHLIFGPVLKQLKTAETSLSNTLPEPDYEYGIIAGKYDHKVPLQLALLKNTKKFIITPHAHTFITYANDVINATKKFLKDGNF
ncbi:MAG: hypothetical protein A2538_02820 [Candidatus Magasanikbacteria bacterium RIFOXYD2_FULL_41_14]|uniref:DUF676 domain-containing protein n=1 Tax=Candidatus Magasanikbacteria bacterium RIFOXYD2_FULL_41_14 TaxID=1798709 RepID=A0A1F6PCE0_9BACT|nr:MAG: hypothetical protein A2538_02820 [Candidatus Magasanikbacteria bacterium RIFOXYD2_FULL_41_14]